MEAIMLLLSQEIGTRFGGTRGEHRAAQRLHRAFADEGLPVRLQQYGFIGWDLRAAPSVRITSPRPRECSAAPIIYSSSTPPGGVTGRLEWHGLKSLIPGLYEMPCYRIVDRHGEYLAQLIVETGGPAIPLLNPRPMFRLPQIVIGIDDHEFLQGLLRNGGDAEAHAEILTELVPDATAYNVIAQYRGAPETDNRVIVNAHYDTQLNTPGCYDNASGVAGLFGLLRRVKEARLPLNIDFVAVASEEIGMHGSSYLAMDLKERGELNQIRACICLDQISAGEKLWIWAAPAQFREMVMASVHEAGLDRLGPVQVDDPMPGCDMWPFHLEGIAGCLYMWWRLADYHKPTDTFDKVDMKKVEGCVEAAFCLLRSMHRAQAPA